MSVFVAVLRRPLSTFLLVEEDIILASAVRDLDRPTIKSSSLSVIEIDGFALVFGDLAREGDFNGEMGIPCAGSHVVLALFWLVSILIASFFNPVLELRNQSKSVLSVDDLRIDNSCSSRFLNWSCWELLLSLPVDIMGETVKLTARRD